MAGESPAGRFVPARTFAEIKDVPNWNDFAPRMGLVYDLFGNGQTAIKYSLNRYNLSRTTGIAANYNPLLSQTATLPWRDKNRNDIADGSLRCDFTEPRLRDQLRQPAGQLRHRRAERVRRVPAHLEPRVRASKCQHELLGGLSVGGSWWKGDFRNLTTTVNQSWTTADYTPYTWYNPTTGQPFTVYARSAAATARPTRNLDTFDPERKNAYESFGFDSQVAHSRRRPDLRRRRRSSANARRSCTAPDDPNYVTATAGVFNGAALCDDFVLDIPWRPQFKMSGTREIGCGINVSMSFQNNSSPTSSRLMTVTRGTHALSGELPVALPGRRDHHADRRRSARRR